MNHCTSVDNVDNNDDVLWIWMFDGMMYCILLDQLRASRDHLGAMLESSRASNGCQRAAKGAYVFEE